MRSLIFYSTSLFIVCRLSLLHFCYFSIVLLKSSSSDALTRVSFSECPQQRFLWRAALLKTDGPSRLSCNRRTSHLLLNLFCWIAIKDMQVQCTQRMSVIPGLWCLLCWHLFLLPERLLFPERLVVRSLSFLGGPREAGPLAHLDVPLHEHVVCWVAVRQPRWRRS